MFIFAHNLWTLGLLAAGAVGLSAPLPVPAAPMSAVKAQLVADVAAVQAGKPFDVGVLFTIDKGWHIYWRNPGDAGLATSVDWQLPEGFTAGPLRWPQPETFQQPGDIVGYGYEGSALLVATVTPPKDLPAGKDVVIGAKATWLGCQEVCVPGHTSLTLALPAADAAAPANGKLFAEWEPRTPPMAPDFTAIDQAGNKVSLGDFKGRGLVLEWFNPDCPFVQRHHAQRSTMIDLQAKWAARGVAWVAVNSTYYMPAETTAEWRDKWKMDYPVLIDRAGKIARAYDAKSTPDMFVIDKQGEIVYEGAIDNDAPGRLKEPVNYVDKALTELLADKPIETPRTKSYGCSVKYPPPSVYGYTMNDIDGRPVDLSRYKGKVLLIVNVASKCGYTPQYAGLEKLYQAYAGQGLVVLGFPANNFRNQEPGTNAEIKTFCTANYNVTFPMFAKISVAGVDQSPLYACLTDKSSDPEFAGPIGWNFTKFLIDRDGKIVDRFESAVEPENQQVVDAVQKALAS